MRAEKDFRADVDNSTRDKVICSTQTGVREVPVNAVSSIEFFGEPDKMRLARADASKGNYKEALTGLADVQPGDLARPILQDEFEYRKLLYRAKLLLAGGSEDESPQQLAEEMTQVGRDMINFLGKHGGSWHYYEGNEMIGDLLVGVGKYDAAVSFYQKLAEAPWPEYKLHADLLRGRAMQAGDKFEAAMQAYDAVLKSDAGGELAKREKQEAEIGRTYSMAGANKFDEAKKTLNDIISKADDDETALLARAYNALGNCYRKQKDAKHALWAYLRVDTVYTESPEARAEALANLSSLWLEMKRPDRSRAARDELQSKYPNSHWTKQAQR
jgi:hypothetical protein